MVWMSQPRLWLGAACLMLGCDQSAKPVVERIVVTEPCAKAVAEAAVHVADPVISVPPLAPPPTRPLVPLTPLHRWFQNLGDPKQRAVRRACEWHAQNPCKGPMLAIPFTDEYPDPTISMLASLSNPQRERVDAYCRLVNAHRRRCSTPLVMAFEDQAIDFASNHGVFAFQGSPVASDWPTAATPWIALDRDGDGAITSGAELFGDGTPIAGTTAHDGFAALATLDANGDGVVDVRDPMFAKLLLWADRDGDRKSTPAELRPLSDVVTSIPLAHTLAPVCDARGNCEGERGIAHLGEARIGAVVDVYLATWPSGR